MDERNHLCPNCQTLLAVPAAYWRREMRCEECSQTFVPNETNLQPIAVHEAAVEPLASAAAPQAEINTKSSVSGFTRSHRVMCLFVLGIATLTLWGLLERGYYAQDLASKAKTYLEVKQIEMQSERNAREMEAERLAIRTRDDLERHKRNVNALLEEAERALATAEREEAEEEKLIPSIRKNRAKERTFLFGLSALLAVLIATLKVKLGSDTNGTR